MKRRAFTLIELVVAMAGCAVILAAIFGIFSRAVHLRDDATARTRDSRVRTHALSVLRNDLRNAWISGGVFAAKLDGSQQAHDGGFPGYLQFVTTTANADGSMLAGDLQEVEYFVAADPDAEDKKAGMLVRTVDSDFLAPVRETPPQEPLLHGVESMQVEFFDGESWQESWTYAAAGDPVPEAVRVRIQTTDSAVPFELLVPWTAQPAQ